MSIKEDLVFCDTCDKKTMQLLLEEMKDLAIKSRKSLFQKFQCNECKRFNERLLQYCEKCQKHTVQTPIDEKPSEMMVETIDQTFECSICGEVNETFRDSDEHTERFLNAEDEDGGVYCDYCMCYRKQELIDKQHAEYANDHDLTTYKCKTCGNTNYGTQDRVDIR